MKTIRFALLGAISAYLIAGYAGSQAAALQGWADRWASTVDVPSVSLLSLVLLVLAILFGLVGPGKETP